MLHLTVLRDAGIFRGSDLVEHSNSEVSLNPSLIRPPSNTYEDALLTSIRLYSNYCVMHYSEGLNRIRSRGQVTM